MDWLSKHRAIVDCDKKIVLLKCPDQSEVTVQGIQSEPIPKVISAMEARRFLRKGCEAFLALILDSKREQVNFEKKFVIREFHNVFPEELPGVPPEREVDLSIKVVQGTTPISRAPYRMAPTELKELKLNYMSYWIRVSFDLVSHLKVHRFYLLRRKMALFGCALTTGK